MHRPSITALGKKHPLTAPRSSSKRPLGTPVSIYKHLTTYQEGGAIQPRALRVGRRREFVTNMDLNSPMKPTAVAASREASPVPPDCRLHITDHLARFSNDFASPMRQSVVDLTRAVEHIEEAINKKVAAASKLHHDLCSAWLLWHDASCPFSPPKTGVGAENDALAQHKSYSTSSGPVSVNIGGHVKTFSREQLVNLKSSNIVLPFESSPSLASDMF